MIATTNKQVGGFFIRGRSPGFSLVEVVLALGLCAFALVSLLALMPVSLNSAKHSTEINRMSKIMQKVASELSQSKFASVQNLTSPEWFFDYDGNEVAENSPDKYFTVEASIADSPVTNQRGTNLVRVRLECDTLTQPNASSAPITICDMGF